MAGASSVGLAVTLLAGPAGAEPTVATTPGRTDEVVVSDRGGHAGAAPTGARGPGGRPAGGGRATGAPAPTVLEPQLRWDDDLGGNCVRVLRVPGDPDSFGAAQREATVLRLIARYPRCPRRVAPRTAGTPAAAAAMTWRDIVDLPSPALRMAPGRAITGLAGCLEIDGIRRLRTTRDSPLGYAVAFDVTSTYDVDWGDGTPGVVGTRSHGGRCPDGDLRHAYRDEGVVTITVTQRWTARWRAQGQQGALVDQLVTRGTLVLPVGDVQAVRTG